MHVLTITRMSELSGWLMSQVKLSNIPLAPLLCGWRFCLECRVMEVLWKQHMAILPPTTQQATAQLS